MPIAIRRIRREAIGTREFETFLVGVMGFDEMTARTDATAISGIIPEAGASTVLPVTFPVTITGCDGRTCSSAS